MFPNRGINIRICPPCLFTIRGASNDIEEISVSGKYGTTSEDTYNIRLSFIHRLDLEIKSKKHAKLQKFMPIASKILSLHALNLCYRIENIS